MYVLLDIVKFGLLAFLILVFIYLVLRIGTMAVMRSIADFRRQEKAKKAVADPS